MYKKKWRGTSTFNTLSSGGRTSVTSWNNFQEEKRILDSELTFLRRMLLHLSFIFKTHGWLQRKHRNDIFIFIFTCLHWILFQTNILLFFWCVFSENILFPEEQTQSVWIHTFFLNYKVYLQTVAPAGPGHLKISTSMGTEPFRLLEIICWHFKIWGLCLTSHLINSVFLNTKLPTKSFCGVFLRRVMLNLSHIVVTHGHLNTRDTSWSTTCCLWVI